MSRAAPLDGEAQDLALGWELLLTPPGAVASADALPDVGFVPALVPGTVASALRALGRFSFETPRDFDAEDTWYRCRFARPDANGGARVRLSFDGLATLAEVFVNGASVLVADNLFVSHSVDVTDLLVETNVLVIRFRALAPELKARKVRPRWRTKLVEQQQLRFFRTTLLGRIPGWSPPVAPVGPFRPVRLEVVRRALVRDLSVQARVESAGGVVRLCAVVEPLVGERVATASIRVAGAEGALSCVVRPDGAVELSGEARVESPPLWWPHTHGAQPLVPVQLVVGFEDGAVVTRDAGRVGFRSVSVDTTNDGFSLRVNGAEIFCRGACWTPLDIVTLVTGAAEYRAALELAKAAGMNMIRVGGTMVYEDAAFYDACDELGILVWQDFMFANMDYPVADPAFAESVGREAREVLGRLSAHPCVSVFCGNSEIAQQAAMLGLPAELWTNELFSRTLPDLVASACPGVPYWPSSPSGGVLPFQVSCGVSHYYGVGAYERPLDDARRANVRFTAECLAFANVPEESTLERLLPEGQPPVHHPLWKTRAPRDRGTGWDFDDVRDHYLEALYRVSSRDLRYGEPERYLDLSRVTTGEVMARTFSEWRRPGSSCKGALVWFHRDLWLGAGWGVVDSNGVPKAAYYHLRRVLQPQALLVTDEGLDGLSLHAVNDGDAPLPVELSVTLYRLGETPVAKGAAPHVIPARGATTVPVQSLLETFIDVTYAYRFGPPSHELVVATMTRVDGGAPLTTAFYFPLGMSAAREPDVGLEATSEKVSDREFVVTVRTRRFAQSIVVQVRGGIPDDSYFHLAPGGVHSVRVRMSSPDAKLQGTVRALNAHAVAKITPRPAPENA